MNQQIVKIETENHRGPLQLTIEYESGCTTDLITSVDTTPKVCIESNIWQFTGKKKTLQPFKAFDENQLGPKQNLADVDKQLWQPDFIYIQFFSQEGCVIKFLANFTEEEAMRESRKNLAGIGNTIKLMRGKFQAIVDREVKESIDKQKDRNRWSKKIADLKKARRIREKARDELDYVAENVNKTPTWAY